MKIQQLQKQIQNMESELEAMKQELNKPEKFEWQYPRGKTYLITSSDVCYDCGGDSIITLNQGRYRIKEPNAKRAVQRNKEANVIEALAEQIDPDWAADWNDDTQEKCYISVLSSPSKYHFTSTYNCNDIGVPYMSQETAIKVCEILNNKEVEL